MLTFVQNVMFTLHIYLTITAGCRGDELEAKAVTAARVCVSAFASLDIFTESWGQFTVLLMATKAEYI